MADDDTLRPEPGPTVYQIRIQGYLGQEWADWFGGLSLRLEDRGETLLTGAMDQAALYGVLKKVRDLGMSLLAVSPIDV